MYRPLFCHQACVPQTPLIDANDTYYLLIKIAEGFRVYF